MSNRIGVLVDSFKVSIREGIVKAREVGASGIQGYAVAGEMDPVNLDLFARKELLKFIKSNDLVVSAVCGDLRQAWVFHKRRQCMENQEEKQKSWI